MASLSFSASRACQSGQGVLTLDSISDAPGVDATGAAYTWAVVAGSGTGQDYGGPVEVGNSVFLPDDTFSVRLFATYADGTMARSSPQTVQVACAGTGTGEGGGSSTPVLVLDSLSHTDETQAGGDGTATIQASGGTAPLLAQVQALSLAQDAASGQPSTFTGLAAGSYAVRVTDSSYPAQVVQGIVEIAAYQAPQVGCQDEYADNYDPQATSGGAASCSYTPRWRSAWARDGMAVRVAAVAGQTLGYVAAKLYVGFRPGHPLADFRPYADPIAVRATVGPDGYARFRLGPLLRPLLGAQDGAGGYRRDLNSPTAYDSDLYVGYELRRADASNELLEHGYALDSAVPDSWLPSNGRLSPFATLPLWPGFDDYRLPLVSQLGAYCELLNEAALHLGPTTRLPCPSNPLPVAWLAAGYGYGYWVLQGRTQVGKTIGEGQSYRDGITGERRYSERGESFRTYQARSGQFKGDGLAEGLATLFDAVQVWLQPVPGGEWVPVTLAGGDYAVRRFGVLRNEFTITFTEAVAAYIQGQ